MNQMMLNSSLGLLSRVFLSSARKRQNAVNGVTHCTIRLGYCRIVRVMLEKADRSYWVVGLVAASL